MASKGILRAGRLGTYLWPALLLWVAPGWGHGVDGAIAPAQGFLVTAMYDDGEPMSYSQVNIQAPDSDLAFQTGRTDRNGRWMFQPDQPGRWQVEVKDGMGHRKMFSVEVGQETPRSASATPTGAGRIPNRGLATVAGLAILFGLAGWGYAWRAWRRNRLDWVGGLSNTSESEKGAIP